MELYNKYKDKGLEIIAINGIGESRETIAAWLQEKGATYPGASNKSPTDLVRKHGVQGYPTNVVLDRQGKKIATIVGYGPNDTRIVDAILKAGIE